MTLSELTIWCAENPRTAADQIIRLKEELARLNPTKVEEPGWPHHDRIEQIRKSHG